MGNSGLMWPALPENDMFRGANKVTLDSKGRLAMPTRYRDVIAERSNGRLIATLNWEPADRCLLIYPLPEWEEAERKLGGLGSTADARRWQRLLIGHATDLDLDANGRILIPPGLREYAQLSRTAMLIGQRNKFELWDEAQWNEKREAWLQADESAEKLPPELASLSL
jgi:MraZ protein